MTSQTLRNHFRVAKKVCQPTHTVRRKIFATDKFRESLPNGGGGRNIRDKNIREGGSDTLRNTRLYTTYNMASVVVWLVGSLTVDESFSVLFAVACL